MRRTALGAAGVSAVLLTPDVAAFALGGPARLLCLTLSRAGRVQGRTQPQAAVAP